MRKRNPFLDADDSELYPHRTNAPFVAFDKLNAFIRDVVRAQAKEEQELDELQEPLAELAEQLVELAARGMSLRAYRRRSDDALRLCREAKASLSPLMRDKALSAAQALRIAQSLDEIIALVTKQWIAVQPPELDDETEAQTH